MEGFITDLKKFYFVDSSNKEVTDMVTALDKFLTTFKRLNNTTRNIFRIEDLEMIGGVAEQTKLWSFGLTHDSSYADQNVSEKVPVIRFDFLALLYRDISLNRTVTEPSTCNGFMQIFKETPTGDFDIEYEAKGIYLSPSEIVVKFESELIYSVASLCDCHAIVRRKDGLSVRKKKMRRKQRCRKCTENMETGYMMIASEAEYGHPKRKQSNLVFKWTSTAKSIFIKDIEGHITQPYQADEIVIQVDITPAYSLDNREPRLSRDGLRTLIPKPCKNCDNSKCWKVSYSLQEIKLIQKTSDSHRHVFMILKTVISLAFPNSIYSYLTIPSEVLKAAFIHHIYSCSNGDIDYLQCLRNILDILSSSFDNRELINLVAENNVLERYEHHRDDFFAERTDCFKILQHIMSLAELIGETDSRVDIIRPLLEKTNSIHQTLSRRNKTLEEYLLSFHKNSSHDDDETIPKVVEASRGENYERSYDRHLPVNGENGTIEIEDNASITSSVLFENILFARRWYPRNVQRTTKSGITNIGSDGTVMGSTPGKGKKRQKKIYDSVASYACTIL